MFTKKLLRGTASQIVMAYRINSVNNTFSADSKNLGSSSEARTLDYMRIFINSGTVFQNAVIGTMVYKGTEEADYEPYTGGEPAPNPIYPYAIKNTGDNVNLLSNLIARTNTTINNGIVTQVTADTKTNLEWKVMKYNNNSKVEELPLIIKNNIGIFSIGFIKDSSFNKIVFGLNGAQISTLVESDVNNLPNGEYTLSYSITNVTQGSISWKDVKLEQGTKATPFSPYGCGNVNEKIEGKNKLDYTKVKPGGTTPVTLIKDGFNAKGLFAGQIVVEGLKENTSYYLSYIRQIITGSTNAITVYAGTTQSTTIKNFAGNGTFNTGNNTTINIWFYVGNGTDSGEANFTNIQLEEGTVKTDYTEYKAQQNPSFPLAEGQKLMEGDYPGDDEKVHHNRMQIVLDGSDDEVFDKRSDTNEIRYYLPRNMKLNGKIIANYFMQRQSSSDKNYVRAVGTEPVNTIMFKSELLNTDEMTIPEWRQYLSEHNLILEIDLAEEQTEDFTEEQKTAWEQIKKARTYKNVTHISSEDETPANVELEYVRDLETVINNLSN